MVSGSIANDKGRLSKEEVRRMVNNAEMHRGKHRLYISHSVSHLPLAEDDFARPEFLRRTSSSLIHIISAIHSKLETALNDTIS